MSEWASPDPGANPDAPVPSAPPVPPAPGQWASTPAWAQPATQAPRTLVPLRPLGVGEILDGAITLVRRNPGPMLALGAVGAVITFGLRMLDFALATGGGDFTFTSDDGTSSANVNLSGTIFVYLGATFLAMTLSGVAAVVLRRALMGERTTVSDLRVPWGRLLLVALVGSVLIGLGVIGFFLFEITLYVWWALAGPVVTLEGAKGWAALKRSRALVRGVWWRTFGILLLTYLISFVVSTVFAVPAVVIIGSGSIVGGSGSTLSTGAQIGISIAAALAAVATIPFTAGVQALLYTDRRMRVEGLDVALRQALEHREAS